MLGLTTASLPRSLTVGGRTVNTTSLLADILHQLDQPINEAVEAALSQSSPISDSSEYSSSVVSQMVGQVSPGVEEAVVGVVTSQQDLLVSQVNSAVAQIVAAQVQSSLLISSNYTSSSPAELTEQVVAAIRPAVVAAAVTEIRANTESQSDMIQSELTTSLHPQIKAVVRQILRTRAVDSFDKKYEAESIASEVMALIKLRISGLLSQSLDGSHHQLEGISSEVMLAIRPTVSRAVSAKLNALKERLISQAVSQSQVSSFVSQVTDLHQAAVASAIRSEAETISDLVLAGLRPNIMKLISATITSGGKGGF